MHPDQEREWLVYLLAVTTIKRRMVFLFSGVIISFVSYAYESNS